MSISVENHLNLVVLSVKFLSLTMVILPMENPSKLYNINQQNPSVLLEFFLEGEGVW